MAPGIVHLVGAGPGDPGLMTARSLELIAAADVIAYDRLIPPDALEGARADAELIYVGKEPGRAAMGQNEINALLVERGGRGQRVVRLKGGDPFVFGRGGEEAEALAQAGVSFEIVPGVTAGVAAPAYAGIPVTNRELASAVAFVTGHEAEETVPNHSASVPNRSPKKPETAIDWEALARFPGTLVFYMGVRNLPRIAEQLIAAGRPADQPAAVVERGTLPGQRSVAGPLGEIARMVDQAGLRAPAITVVGEAAALRERLAWLERRPLHGRRVAVTRARAQASGLADRLAELGADVVQTPAIRIEPRSLETGDVAKAIRGLDAYRLMCFTSRNGVALFFRALALAERDARALGAGVTIAAIGSGTDAELRRHGVTADVVPERSVAEGLVDALESLPVAGQPILVAGPGNARDVLPDALANRGGSVDVVAFYDTVAEPLGDEQRERLAGADYVTFTSSSTVRFLLEAVGPVGLPGRARLVSIGPITSATMREHGLRVDVEAQRHDVDGLVEALVRDAGPRR